MRIASLFAAFLLAFSGQLLAQRSCGAEEVLHQQLLNNPALIERLSEIEAHTHEYETSGAHERIVVTIPVVVHVIYNTAAQNISDAQINSQIAVLNADFRKLNADASSVPAAFAGLAADLEINFCLAVRDPNGAATTGITRTSTTVTSFGTNDAMKYTAQGGRDAWPSSQYLNLWVCNLSGGVLGYAQFPGGPAATDGVVILTSAFGTTGTATAPFNKGRTGTHEVGHWLNLYHICGDDGTSCSGSDSVADTPNQADENYGCPTFPQISCSNGPNGDMFMNYMDYTDDACMYMFTTGQKTRAQALFSTGGSRVSLLSSMGCVPPSGVTCTVPTGLSSSSITTTSATVSWGAVSGATSYTLQYKTAAATTWTTVTGITTTSSNLTGLTAGTTYNFQVMTVCSTGSSAYSTAASFTTTSTGTTCAVPSGLTSSAVASTTATVSWGAVSGATSYTLQYKTAAATTWTTVTGITTTSRNLTGLTAATTYNFKVLTVCSTGSSAYSTAASFTTTSASGTCTDAYETNNTLATAKTIAVNTDITAVIGTSTDKDYLKFSNTAATKNIKVDLTNLPADYDLKLYKGSTLVGTSQNLGTAAEQLKYNTTTAATTYTAYVYGYNGAFSASQCYTLRISLSASSWRTDGSTDGDVTELDIPVQFENAGFGMFPNPAKDELTIEVAMENDNDVQVSVMDAAGRIAVQQNQFMGKGNNQTKLSLNTLTNGIYFVQVRNGEAVNTRKLVIQK